MENEKISFVRCSLHDKQIETNVEAIKELGIIVKGDNNGTRGHAMRIHDVETTVQSFLEGEKKRRMTLNAITVAVSVQIAIIVIRDYVKPILEHVVK